MTRIDIGVKEALVHRDLSSCLTVIWAWTQILGPRRYVAKTVGQLQTTAAYLLRPPRAAFPCSIHPSRFLSSLSVWSTYIFASQEAVNDSRKRNQPQIFSTKLLPRKMASSNASDLTLTSTVDLLAPGVSMPRLSFGIYRVQPSETVEVVLAALDTGYRHIDSAQLYNNEAELGRAIHQSGVDRSEVFLTTKIRYPGMNKAKTWKKVLDSVSKVSGTEVATGRKRKRVDDGEITPAVEGQADAGGEYVDLFLVHTPYGGPNAKKERREMWLALERAFEEGRARAIGVSNYKVEHLEEMREYAKVWPPHVNQI